MIPLVHVERIPDECPECGASSPVQVRQWPDQPGGLWTCRIAACSAIINVAMPDPEEILRRLVEDHGDHLRALCDDPDECDCAIAAAFKWWANEDKGFRTSRVG